MAFLNKHILKVLIAFFIVLFFIFASSSDSQADTLIANDRMTTDVNLALKNEMNSRMQFIYSIFFAKWDTMTQQQINATKNIAQNMLYYNYYIDTVYTQYSGNSYAQYIIYFYKSKNVNVYSVGTNQLLIYYKDMDTDVDRFAIGTYQVTIESMFVVRDLAIINEFPGYNIVADVSNIGINGKKARR